MELQARIVLPRERAQKLGEEIANAVSHGIAALLSIAGLVLLLLRAVSRQGGALAVVSVSIYGASMILLYLNSCLYHALALPRGKYVFRILDHCSIFFLILGTYIPMSLVGIGGALGWTVFGIITACALVGIVLNSVDLHRFKRFSLVLYIVMGWLALFTLLPIWRVSGNSGIALLLAGGVFYTAGVFFYKQKERPYMHFIWHLFVLAGSFMHFLMIYQHYCC